MVKLVSVVVATAVSAVIATGALAKAPRRRVPLAQNDGSAVTRPKESHFYIKGANAPFQNQLRKLTDPLNANGAK